MNPPIGRLTHGLMICPTPHYTVGKATWDDDDPTKLSFADKTEMLTRHQHKLFKTLLTASGRMQNRETLLDRVYGAGNGPHDRRIDVLISQLRKKLEDKKESYGNWKIIKTPPRLHGAKRRYYDNLLTQFAIEWELKRALADVGGNRIDVLQRPGTLPLREAAEKQGNPLIEGSGRCAAISISTLLVFKRPNLTYHFLLKRRSRHVLVSPGVLHVAPSEMFESKHQDDHWSVEMNVWREILEEVYDKEDQQGDGYPDLGDHILGERPIKVLIDLIGEGSAEFSVTGFFCDLLSLRPEICTVLFVKDPVFSMAGRMKLNWEYEPDGAAGIIVRRWEDCRRSN